MALVNKVMDLEVPYKVGNILSDQMVISFSRTALFHGVR
jgi:hypothetical protein